MISNLLDLSPDLRALVRECKKVYPAVYLVEVDLEQGRDLVVFRAITKREADRLDAEPDELRQQEDLLSLALLHPRPYEIDLWPLGAAVHVIKSIIKVSGWSTEGLVSTMSEAQEYAQTLDGAMVAFICGAFSAFKPAEIENMTQPERARHLKLAELAHGRPFDFQPWLDPEGWAKKNRKRMRKIPGGKFQELEVPEGAAADVQAVANEQAERSQFDIMADQSAVKLDKNDPNMIRRLVEEQRRGMGG